ncbi:hypothetical protein [Paraburkholderia sp. BR13439]|uniref:hypothetical protein n=1 Tax=Paraburkholderia sp. BR13439 TaxID=3236996 RepID=UPI0034CE55DF
MNLLVRLCRAFPQENALVFNAIRSFPDCMLLIDGTAVCPETKALHRERLRSTEKHIANPVRHRARRLETLNEGCASSLD